MTDRAARGSPRAVGPHRLVDPRAVRVTPVATLAAGGPGPIVVEPPAVPVAPAPRLAGSGMLGGVSGGPVLAEPRDGAPDGIVLVDDLPVEVRLERLDALHLVLIEGGRDGAGPTRHPVIMLPAESGAGLAAGVVRREVIVDGWRIELDVESERRASLLERARRGREETAHGGPTEVRAIIPGRVVAVSIAQGDSVVAGQQLLVVEAMKMQNELRAPRDGVIERVGVGTGSTIEVGDLLLVLA